MIDGDRLEADLHALAQFGRRPDGGVTRLAYSPEYAQAEGWLAARMASAGLSTRVDPAGNLIGRIGPPGPAIVIGSHIDTVPGGGTLDGALGVLAGLECVRALRDEGTRLGRALEVVAFADEEGRFLPHLGSRAMAGRLAGEVGLPERKAPDGVRLLDAAAGLGLDAADVATAARPRRDLLAYLELHIEQGSVLESRGIRVGAVDSICGVSRTRYEFVGRTDHSGATPHDLRQDALMAAAESIAASEDLRARVGGPETRITFGRLTVEPNVDCAIAGRAQLSCEVRDPDKETIDTVAAAVGELAHRLAGARGVELSRDEYTRVEPAPLSPEICSAVERACRRAGVESIRMTSGAGHDAQSFADLTQVGMIFVPSIGGHSHCAEEATDPADLELGTEILFDVVRELACGAPASPPAAEVCAR
ncbi:MAG: Zn-dependent hydrolase [Solirubrobacterales bacterium]